MCIPQSTNYTDMISEKSLTIIKSSRNHCNQEMNKYNTPMLLSLIKYDSTCVSLKLHHSLVCLNCEPKLNPLSFKREQNMKKERHKSNRCKCQQD